MLPFKKAFFTFGDSLCDQKHVYDSNVTCVKSSCTCTTFQIMAHYKNSTNLFNIDNDCLQMKDNDN